MDQLISVKTTPLSILGLVGGTVAGLCGGWDGALALLVGLMSVDYITGWILAFVFKRSPKTCSGGLNSNIGFRGICKKGVILMFVFIAYRLDEVAGSNFIRTATIMFYAGNETTSLMENVGLMGIEFPGPIKRAIDVLAKKEEK